MANEVRLIDAVALMGEVYDSDEKHGNDVWHTGDIEYLVMAQPTVDAVEVVHGRWEWYTDTFEALFLGCDEDYGWRCSNCKEPLDEEADPEVMPTFRYCPNCGAKMRGDSE